MRPAIHRDVRLSSLYDDLAASGRDPGTTLLAHESCTPATAGLSTLSELLPADEPLQMMRRLRRADGEPLAIMTNYLLARFELDDDALAGTSLYELLRLQGAQIAIAHQAIGARLADADEAHLLEQPRPLACVTAERVVYDAAGALVELGRHLYRSDLYTVQTSLVV
ncbi:MAG: UTRA domain-containing protein [Pseudonocardia sp.]|nr:UTRA domain-containing protein [Pseudonocardia sp.]